MSIFKEISKGINFTGFTLFLGAVLGDFFNVGTTLTNGNFIQLKSRLNCLAVAPH
jgi:hypothetical protein